MTRPSSFTARAFVISRVPRLAVLRSRQSRGGLATLALVYAQDGHGFGQGIDGFLMLARVMQGLSFGP